MSIAGIRSNQGDSYQTLVAFDWALTVLSNPDFQWIEIDSVAYSVDDVVVRKTDGTLICCQCKKNQIDFKSWTISNLADELDKAFRLLATNQQAEIHFYSRNPFGALAKLREYSTIHANEASYRASFSQENQTTDTELAAQIAAQPHYLSTYDFLHRTTFETSPEFNRMEALLQERLRQMASNPRAAYDALWTRLNQLGSRLKGDRASASAQHRFTKNDLTEILYQAGAMLVPTMNLVEVRSSFASTSAIGRSWRRVIAGQSIPRPVLKELLEAIDSGKRAVLLTGLPGSGKTCVMLSLQETLEQRAQTRTDIVPLFIQSREFADLATAQDRQAQGLPGQWVEKAARIAEDAKVIVIIDSLDVLSIAREHSVLTYFLAQIDRLLLIPNITVITACRDFDRHYDRRIAERQWDFERKCLPLDWESEIVPLLDTLAIDTTAIDDATRELIRNLRELALFVELAQREGSFNIVTSQALAQRYLDTIVRADNKLGETAIQAIEAIANEMLRSRKLVVPHQRFTALPDMQRALCSLNVLQKTHNGELTFGHQTLLDVLVISGAMRQGITLNEFVQSLSPVPFVRPSIRSFIAQLAMGERREFRKQLRTVLTSNVAFHVRRLVAESLAEQKPEDDDWPLIRDLRENHREVFQVIYAQAKLLEWHHFWFRHLVPVLKDARDVEGLTAHAHRVSLWKNQDAAGVLEFWTAVLQLDWMDELQIALQLTHYLSKIDAENLALVAPLLEQMLCLPRQEHSFLGHVLAQCVTAGVIEDVWLWRYIAGDISDDDVRGFQFENKLHCKSHEFGNNSANFILQRMKHSTTLLDLALEFVERWNQIKSSRYGNARIGYLHGFLSKTSYEIAHSQQEIRHKDSLNILMDSVESAILHDANTHSAWWQKNCERLAFNQEGALRYFTILACTSSPETNLDLIGRMVQDKELLESCLSFELGNMMQAAFIYLDSPTQDAVMKCILSVHDERPANEHQDIWTLGKRAELIVTIPCFLRSPKTQAVLEAYEKQNGTLIRQPQVHSRGGTVCPPFSFEVFLRTDDSGVLRLLSHYSGYKRDFGDFLVGGFEAVSGQLGEASSRNPTRFMDLLSSNWADIPEEFRDAIMSGCANYLAHRYGNLQANTTWKPLDEPDPIGLARHILDELERHPSHWQRNRAAANALQACAYVIKDTQDGARLVFWAIGYVSFRDENTITGDSDDLIFAGINTMCGHVAEATMILANEFQEHGVPFPELLSPTLCRFAANEQPAIRALILRRLPYLQGQHPVLGWDLFNLAMRDVKGLWEHAEHCLYYAYHNNFEKVAPFLGKCHREGSGKDLETWGRISSLAALAGHIVLPTLLSELKELGSIDAWSGAASVWTNHGNYKEHREQCLAGIEAGLNAAPHNAAAVAQKMEELFRDDQPVLSVPIKLINCWFCVLGKDNETKHHHLYWFDKWLNALSQRDPSQALALTESYLTFVTRTKSYLYDHENSLTQLMTRLFAEAEEREETDQGVMLHKVVEIQDKLLSLGVTGVNDWIKAAERP